MDGKIVYFDVPGKENTDGTIKAVLRRADDLKVNQIVVASTHGYTAKRIKEAFQGRKVDIVAVSICAGFAEEGWTMSRVEREELEKRGIKVVTGTHALGDDVNETFTASAPNRIVRETLYRFCQGMKVAVEVSMMAADAGVLDMTRELIAVGGTNEGADTAIVLKPAYTRKFKEIEIREILAKPRSHG